MTDRATVWVVDDHRSSAEAIAEIARGLGESARAFLSAEAAIEALEAHPPEVLVTDLRLPGVDGVALLSAVRARAPGVAAVVVTAHGSIDEAVRAMRAGAVDFLTKPLDVARVEAVLRGALDRARLSREVERLRDENVSLAPGAPGLVFRSAAMRALLDQADRVAASDATVLLTGESGTGKERLARHIHERSRRARGPFVAVHVAALAEGVLASELFGHERGAFTGADRRHLGRFEQAAGGTLFLDEIGEIDPALQVKLLRVLQERVVARVGGSVDVPVDVRVVAATHRDLDADVATGRFRADLFYRLDVVRLHVPALRARAEDVPYLVAHFLDRFSARYGRPVPEVPEAVARALLAHDWPGNVRELENVVERLVVMAQGGRLSAEDLPGRLLAASTRRPDVLPPGDVDLPAFLDRIELALITRALDRAGGNKSQAARSLGVTRETFRYKLVKHGLDD